MNLLKKIFTKIYMPSFRYNTFYGNQGVLENAWALIILFIPSALFKKKISEYEDKFGEFSGGKWNFSYAMGRMALYQGLRALDKDEKDEILLPSFTCVVVPNAIIYAGFKPCYVDIEDTYYNFDIEDLKKKIGPKTKAIYLQYTFGHHSSAEEIIKLAKDHNLPIIEDCAHLLGQKIKFENQYLLAGSIGIFSFFSTDHSKVISTGVGGMLCTNDEKLAKKIKSLDSSTLAMSFYLETRILLNFLIESLLLNRWTYWIGEFVLALLMRAKIIYHFNNEYIVNFEEVQKYPLKMSGRLASLGCLQLNQLNESNSTREELVRILNEIIPLKDKTKGLVLLRYSFLVQDRDALDSLLQKKIILGSWFSTPFQGRDKDFSDIYYSYGSCPKAEFISKHIANFPLHKHMPVHVLITLSNLIRPHLLNNQ